MGLLDNNKVITTPSTGLEGSDFKQVFTNDAVDVWKWNRVSDKKNLRLTYRDIYAWSDDRVLYLVQGKITDTPTAIEVNDTNFPNIRKNARNQFPKIVRVIACPCQFFYESDGRTYGNVDSLNGRDCRVCVIFDNGQIYHNYPSCNNTYDFLNSNITNQGSTRTVAEMFTKFDESVVWDLPTRKAPVKTTSGTDATLIATGKYYYNPALPDKCYEFHPDIGAANGYGNTVGFAATNSRNDASNVDVAERPRFWRTDMENPDSNSFDYMGGYAVEHHFTMIGTYRSNSKSLPARTGVFGTQDGGRSWYLMYEFDGIASVGVPLAQIGTAGSGIYAISKRTLVLPSAADKEPAAPFTWGEDVNVESIVGDGTDIIFTTSSAHGLSNGNDIIVKLQNEASLNDRAFDWMVNTEVSATSGGNGILLKVKDVTSTTFKVSLYPYNPDATLRCRHIHALNHCKDGVSVSTGEDYPQGGWLLYDAIRHADNFSGYNVANLTTQNKFVRLTSTSTSVTRALGFIVRQEGKDTFIYVGVDTSNIEMNNVDMPENRTESFKHNSCGVWKIPLDDVDSLKDNGLLKYNGAQPCFMFQQFGNAFVFLGQGGEFAVSYDNGESWTATNLPVSGISRFSGMTYDRKFSVENILVQLKK